MSFRNGRLLLHGVVGVGGRCNRAMLALLAACVVPAAPPSQKSDWLVHRPTCEEVDACRMQYHAILEARKA